MKSSKSPKQVESELKYSLSKPEYLKLKKHLSQYRSSVLRQTNFYFDTKSLSLKKKQIGLRIRNESSKKSSTLTVKFPKSQPSTKFSALKIRTEIEASIPKLAARQTVTNLRLITSLENEPLLALRQKVASSTLQKVSCLGALKTKRIVFRIHSKLFLELDCSSYFGKVFYELEIETKSPVKIDRWIRTLFEELKISYQPGYTSKLQRFLVTWKTESKKKRD